MGSEFLRFRAWVTCIGVSGSRAFVLGFKGLQILVQGLI